MLNLAQKADTGDIHLQICEVKGKSGQGYMILVDNGLIRAARAAGCLLEPEVGDQVLAALAVPDRAYILSVLERGELASPACLSFKGQTSLKVDGDLHLTAHRLGITGAEDVTLNSANLNLNTINGQARFAAFSFMGGFLEGRLERLKTTARYIDTAAERIIQKFKRSYRRVEEYEESKSGRVRLLVKDLFYLRSRNSTIKSQKRVKVDGEKIMLG